MITGPSDGGIGAQTAVSLAAGEPQEIILAGRNKDKIQPVIEQIQERHPKVRVTFVQLDLADLSSVRKAAKEISDNIQKLDVLINNAGSESAFTAFWSLFLKKSILAHVGTSNGSERLHNH